MKSNTKVSYVNVIKFRFPPVSLQNHSFSVGGSAMINDL